MPKPLYKYDKWICPICGNLLIIRSIVYDRIKDGVFKTGKLIRETSYECNTCGYLYYTKETE